MSSLHVIFSGCTQEYGWYPWITYIPPPPPPPPPHTHTHIHYQSYKFSHYFRKDTTVTTCNSWINMSHQKYLPQGSTNRESPPQSSAWPGGKKRSYLQAKRSGREKDFCKYQSLKNKNNVKKPLKKHTTRTSLTSLAQMQQTTLNASGVLSTVNIVPVLV